MRADADLNWGDRVERGGIVGPTCILKVEQEHFIRLYVGCERRKDLLSTWKKTRHRNLLA